MAWVHTAPGSRLTMVKNPPRWKLTVPFCVLGWPPLAFVGKVTVAFLVLRSQAWAQDTPLTGSGSNRGFDPWSSTRVPERLEQTAENCWTARAGSGFLNRLDKWSFCLTAARMAA